MGATPDAGHDNGSSNPPGGGGPKEVRKGSGTEGTAPKAVPLWLRAARHVGLAQHQPDDVRLVTDVQSLRAWVEAREHARTGSEDHYVNCTGLLNLARDAAVAKDVASGYEYLHIAERESVYLMTGPELRVRAQSLRAETESSDKFANSWRKGAILKQVQNACELVAIERQADEGKREKSCWRLRRALSVVCGHQDRNPEEPRDPSDALEEAREAIAVAVEHRNTLLRNEHRKADKLRWQLAWLGTIVGGLVITGLVLVIIWPLQEQNLAQRNLLPYGIYLGLLGGLVSSAISQRTADRKVRVPEIEVGFYAALARGALGAATSIPAYLLVKTGLVTVGLPKEPSSALWGLLFLCFFAGFSERWFLSSVTTFARDDKEPKKSESKVS